jgi:autotransporter passenger strand-loop-strand repeat protein
VLSVSGGLSDPSTILSGGTLIVRAGGTDIGANVSAGGSVLVSSGGVELLTSGSIELGLTRLGDLGWIEGRNIVVEFRSAEGRLDCAGEAAAEFARMRVAVILIGGDSEVLAAKRSSHDTDRRRSCRRSSWQRFGRELGAARRQRHRHGPSV